MLCRSVRVASIAQVVVRTCARAPARPRKARGEPAQGARRVVGRGGSIGLRCSLGKTKAIEPQTSERVDTKHIYVDVMHTDLYLYTCAD